MLVHKSTVIPSCVFNTGEKWHLRPQGRSCASFGEKPAPHLRRWFVIGPLLGLLSALGHRACPILNSGGLLRNTQLLTFTSGCDPSWTRLVCLVLSNVLVKTSHPGEFKNVPGEVSLSSHGTSSCHTLDATSSLCKTLA